MAQYGQVAVAGLQVLTGNHSMLWHCCRADFAHFVVGFAQASRLMRRFGGDMRHHFFVAQQFERMLVVSAGASIL